MPQKLQGEISLGVGPRVFRGVWLVDTHEKNIIYRFNEFIGPTRTIVKSYTKWHHMLPYEMGGEIVNEAIEAERRANEDRDTLGEGPISGYDPRDPSDGPLYIA